MVAGKRLELQASLLSAALYDEIVLSGGSDGTRTRGLLRDRQGL